MRRSSSPCRTPRTRRTSSTCGKSRPISATSCARSQPDLWIIFSNDHAEQFFHNAAPPFTVHVGGEATGEFAGRKFHWKVPSEIGFEIVRQLYRQNFDPAFTSTAKIDYAIGIPLTHIGHTEPVLPIYVNAYLPPQPTMERCYSFGQAVARTVTALGLKTVVLSSGGMSHFPGTDRYSNPELTWDKRVLEKLKAGNLKSLIGYDETELDETGNIELRCWACAAGALGERKPDVVSMDPSWHHNYASLAWTGGQRRGGARRALSSRSSPSWSSSLRRCMGSPTMPTCARNTWPTRRPSRTSSSCRRISARR